MTVHVDVIASVNEARSDDFVNRTSIVIDVLRATSTMVTALEYGCSSIVPVETVYQAKHMQGEGDLLGGERFGKKISGFDLGNSPLEYVFPDIQGKRIIMTTTNGTRAIYKAQKAAHVIAGSMLNAASCAKAATNLKRDIVIVCAGTQDRFSLEDGLCAGLIIEELREITGGDIELNDFALAMHCTYRELRHDLEEALLMCANGKRLCRMGYKEDVLYCSRVNRFTVVPVLRELTMLPYRQF